MEKNVIGNTTLLNNIKALAYRENFSHSYIIEGAKGSGKSLISRFFAKSVLCESIDENKPCNACVSCISFDNNNNPDFLCIKRTKLSIGVDLIRKSLGDTVHIKPFRSKYKVVIIEDGDTLTVEAQNALLKSIEEPPSYMIFLIEATNRKKLLPTVLSRCNTLSTSLLNDSEIDRELSKIINYNTESDDPKYIDEKYKKFVIRTSSGSLGKAKNYIQDTEFINLRRKLFDFLKNIDNYDIVQVLKSAEEIAKEKVEPKKIYEVLILWYRDLAMYKATDNTKDCLNIDLIEDIQAISKRYSLNKIYKKINSVNTYYEYSRYNANAKMNLEVLFLRLREK
ncbi:MAG: ATP-binding protein [Lachnospirales bacterium]